MEPSLPQSTSSTCLRSIIGVILGVLPLGLLFVDTLRLCTPAFVSTFVLTAGIFLLDLVGFLSYWWAVRRTANTCLVVGIYCYFALLFLLGFFLFLGNITCGLQHGLHSGF